MREETKILKYLAAKKVGLGNRDDYLNAAVTLPLVRKNGVLSMLFEVRAGDLTWQPGDICFPGGKIEDKDCSPLDSALRETSEELGIHLKEIKLLGALDFIISSIGVLLYPFVVELPPDATLHPNREEVAEIFTVPLDYLLQTTPATGQMRLFTRPLDDFPFHLFKYGYPDDYRQRGAYSVLFYQYEEYLIWGLTAKLLSNFLKVYRTIL